MLKRRCWTIDRFTLMLMLLLGALLLVPQTVQAGGTVGDGTPGSCTETALDTRMAGGGTVTFNCGASPLTITVSSAKVIAADTAIDGGNLITIGGGSNHTRIISVTNGISLTLANLTIDSGHPSSGDGGGVYNNGSLTVRDSTFSNNGFTGFDLGRAGGIYNTGTLTVTNSTFSSNSARTQHGGGGAIYNVGTASVTGTSFSSNQIEGIFGASDDNGGGGIYNAGTLAVGGSSFANNSTVVASNSADISNGAGVYNSGTMTISSSTFVTNTSGREAGAIFNAYSGQATVSDTSVISNTSLDIGGGLANTGVLTVTNSTVVSNTAASGGGIYNAASGTLAVISGTVASNVASYSMGQGGGLANYGTATIVGSTFNGNDAPMGGDGILNSGIMTFSGGSIFSNLGNGLYNEGTASISDSAVYSNTQSGIANTGALTVTRGVITDNSTATDGGGIVNYYSTSRLTIDHSEIARNSAANNGGGIYVSWGGGYPTVLIYDSSLYSNTASHGGAFGGYSTLTISNTAIYSNTTDGISIDGGSAQIVNSTVSGNSGAGVRGGGTTLDYDTIVSNTVGVELQGSYIGNSILAQNSTNCYTPYGYIVSNGYNVLGNISSCILYTTASDQTGVNPLMIGPLQDNGGSTWTRALLPGSPAIDAANPGSSLANDQMGIPRPQPAGGRRDVGAYELPVREFRFSAASYSVWENAGAAVITVTHGTAPALVPLTVTIQSSDNTATAGVDYTAISRTLTFAPGVTTMTTTVPITNDLLIENDESLRLTLSNPVGIGLGTPYTATLTILDDEPRVRLSSPTYSVPENLGPAVITVTLSPTSAQPVIVDFRTTDGTASSATDYAAISRTLAFAPGNSVVTVTIPITDDILSEPNETVNIDLSNPTGASLGLSSAVLTIMDDEPLNLVVNSTGDAPDANPGDGICDTDLATPGSQCTLRAAIQEANLRKTVDTISFSVTGTITLTSSLPPITDSVHINGPGAGTLIVNANGTGRQLSFNSQGSNQSSTASDLTLTGGAGEYNPSGYSGGGAIYVGPGDTAILSGMVITGNNAYGGGYGGSILDEGGTITLTSSLIANGFGSYGGGMYIVTGTVAVSNTTITGNSGSFYGGGGIANAGGTLTVNNSAIYGNTTLNSMGGGLDNGATAVIANSDIYSNTSSSDGGGIANSGGLTLSATRVMSNTSNGAGGGIYNIGTLSLDTGALRHNSGVYGGGLGNSVGGQATISRTSIYSNTAYYGGGVSNYETLTMTNVTVGNNRTSAANGDGGGVLNNLGSLLLQSVTVAGNVVDQGDGGGIRVASGSVTMRNTLVASNAATVRAHADISGTVTSLGYNLVGKNDGSTGLIGSDLSGTNALPINAKMATFDGQAYPLLAGSPAIDAGDNGACPATDQRGVARPVDGDGNGIAVCDIGAFEFQPGLAAPSAAFVAFPLSGTRPLTVTFTNQSTDYTSSLWSFGDGVTSTLDSPVHVFDASGVFTVSLTVSKDASTSTITHTSYITVYRPVTADFTANPITGTSPLNVTFTNLSDGDYTSSSWSFGDGTTSTLQNPAHVYTQSGTYTVTLSVSGPGGSSSKTRSGYVTVGPSQFKLFLPFITRN